MTFRRVLSAVLVPTCWVFASVAEDVTTAAAAAAATGGTATPGPAVTNSSGLNSTHGGGKSSGGLMDGLNVNSSMIQRALYVLIGITMIGVLYFLIRAVR